MVSPRIVEDERLASSQVAKLTGATYRQLDYWATRGYVVAERPTRVPSTLPTSGVMRLWSLGEVAVIRRMVRLLHAGIVLEVAADLARKCTPGKSLTIGDGVQLIIDVDLLFDSAEV